MKTLSVALFALTALCSGFNASATSIIVAETSTLSNFDVDPALGISDVQSGSVTIHNMSQKIDLVLQLLDGQRKISLPIVERKLDGCGSVVYTARQDRRPVDGILQEFVLRDNRARVCMDAVLGTELNYRTESLRGGKTNSNFVGAPLEAGSGAPFVTVKEGASLSLVSSTGTAPRNLLSSHIVVDRKSGKLSLTYQQDICPPVKNGFACKALMAPQTIELKIVSDLKDDCGSAIIVAREDRRPVDGALEELRLVDNRGRVCENVVKYMTEVTYSFEGIRPNTKGSLELGGDALAHLLK